MSDNPNLAAALYHAAAGRPVFPCSPLTKQPAIAKRDGGNGFKDATTDPDVIRAWWARYPDAVPGMPTGARVGVWVLDVDSKPGKVGRDTLAQFVATFGPLPDTVETITATGGSHLFFRHPRDGRLIPNSASRLGQGSETWGSGGYPAVPFARADSGKLVTPDLDIRGDGGYVILPGAVMADGRTYQWEGSSDPDEGAQVAVAPDWLLALVTHDPSAVRAPGAAPPGDAKPIGEGERNDHLYRLGLSLRAKGLTESVVVAALLAENAERCDPPLPMPEVIATAKSAVSKPAGLSPEFEAYLTAKRAGETALPFKQWQAARGSCQPPTPVEDARRSASSPAGEVAEKEGSLPGSAAPGGGSHSAPPPPTDPGPPNEDPPPDRPQVQIIDGELPQAVDAAERHLIAAGIGIYQRGDQGLVRIAHYSSVPSAAIERREAGACVITELGDVWLADQMTRHITWLRWDARKGDLARKDCPTKVAATLLARGGAWAFPYLAGFCGAPLLALDGRLIAAPGYDAGTGLFLVDPPEIEPIMTTDRHLAEWAGERLCALLGIGVGNEPERFPFATNGDQAAALAMAMTALLRPILPTAPICAVSAATPGTGKSLWVDVLATLALGHKATVVNLGKDEEETEKRIGAQLMLGESFSFDNIEGAFRSSALCTAATQESMNVRVLSQSRMARVLTRVNIWLTGNNVSPLGDLARRVLLARLDAGCERPEQRVFQVDAIERTLAARAEAIRCALLITRAYLDAGCPTVAAPPTGSFRMWDRMVRYPLIWAGYADPLGRADDLREADHSLSGLGLLMQAWQRVRPLPCTSAELYELITSTVPLMSGGTQPQFPELHDAAVQIRGDPRKWTARDLGYVFRSEQGRIVGGLKIVACGKSMRGQTWVVQESM